MLASSTVTLGRLLRLAGSVALLTWLALSTDWRQVAEAFARLRWEYWVLGLALYIGAQVVSSLRWQLLARPLGFQQPIGEFVRLYFIGMFFNLCLPTSVGGDVMRAWYLGGRPGRRSLAALSVLLERGCGLVVLLIIACVAIFFCPVPLPGWTPWVAGTILLTGGLGFVGLLRTARKQKHSIVVVSLLSGLRHAPFVPAVLLSIVVQAANVLLVWLLGVAMGLDVPGTYYWVLVPVVSLLTLLPISLNGMGVREGATVIMLAPLGIGAGTALALALVWFATFAVASLAGLPLYLTKRDSQDEERTDDRSIGDHSDQGRTGQRAAAA